LSNRFGLLLGSSFSRAAFAVSGGVLFEKVMISSSSDSIFRGVSRLCSVYCDAQSIVWGVEMVEVILLSFGVDDGKGGIVGSSSSSAFGVPGAFLGVCWMNVLGLVLGCNLGWPIEVFGVLLRPGVVGVGIQPASTPSVFHV